MFAVTRTLEKTPAWLRVASWSVLCSLVALTLGFAIGRSQVPEPRPPAPSRPPGPPSLAGVPAPPPLVSRPPLRTVAEPLPAETEMLPSVEANGQDR